MADPEAAARARMLDYLRSRARMLDAAQVRARVRAAAAEFEAAVAKLDEATARRAGPGGEWSVAQIVDHVAQSAVRGAEELRHLLAGRRPPGPPVYDGLVSGAAHWVSWVELRAGLRDAARAIDAALADAPAESAASAATVPAILVAAGTPEGPRPRPFTAELTWKEYALVLRLHYLDHREQVRRLRAAAS